jgi:hypothetical protein
MLPFRHAQYAMDPTSTERIKAGDVAALVAITLAIASMCIFTLTPGYSALLSRLTSDPSEDAVQPAASGPPVKTESFTTKTAPSDTSASSPTVVTTAVDTTDSTATAQLAEGWIVFRIENHLSEKINFEFLTSHGSWVAHALEGGAGETYALPGPITPHIRFDCSYEEGFQSQEYDVPGKDYLGPTPDTNQYVLYYFAKGTERSIDLFK